MALTLMYITNNEIIADIAQRAGVDRIWIDMEYIGKEGRQAGMNTVKSHHTIEDIVRIRPIVKTSQLMARVNPLHEATKDYCSSQEEIENTVKSKKRIKYLFLETVGFSKTQIAVATLCELGLIVNEKTILKAVSGAPKSDLMNSATYKFLAKGDEMDE